MLELYQTEWCPSSHRVRQRLTELGLDVIVRQVPADRADRLRLLQRTGVTSIPVLVDGNEPVIGEAEIVDYLERCFDEPPGAAAHCLRAEVMRGRVVEEPSCQAAARPRAAPVNSLRARARP